MTSLSNRHIGMLGNWVGMLMSFIKVVFCLRVIVVLPLKSGPTGTMSFDMKEDQDAEEEAQA